MFLLSYQSFKKKIYTFGVAIAGSPLFLETIVRAMVSFIV